MKKPILFLSKFACVFFLYSTTNIFGMDTKTDEYKKTIERKTEKVEVYINQKKFEPSAHALSKEHWKIDGVTPYGVDGFEVYPSMEIDRFTITWNGNEIPMPSEMYKDCYSPCLKISDESKYVGAKRKVGEAIAADGIMTRWDNKNNMLQIIMVSSIWASAPYFVVWNITPYGVHSRERVLLGS